MKLKFKVSECSCSVCASMCRNPCIPTPEEAQELISRGHKENLTIWTSYSGSFDTTVVRPKYLGDSHRQCVYFSDGKCLLHNLNLKPLEGRLAHHDSPTSSHEYVCSRWNSPLGEKLVNLISEEQS